MAKGKTATKPMKTVPGKSAPKTSTQTVYKPNLWLDEKQLPKELKGAKYGDTVSLTVQAKVAHTGEGAEGKSVTLELQKMSAANPKK